MNQRNNNSNNGNSSNSNARITRDGSPRGLILSGTVIDRTRRMVPHDSPTTEIVTYTVQDNCSRKFYVDDYAPCGYYDIGSDVYLPVYIKAYSRRNGDPSYTLNVQKTEAVRGEHF